MQVEVSAENYQKQRGITSQINECLSNIKRDTGMMSTMNHAHNHEDYAKLLAMGDKIVNYLFYLIMHQGGDWVIFMLLHELTGVQPIPDEDYGRFPRVMMHWLKWWTESEYYKNNDIHFGLA